MTRTLQIAVAQDEQEAREYLHALLTRLGHQVVSAENGRQLVERCRAAQPDLAITDLRLPDMDGIETVIAVSREREIPFILITGDHDGESMHRAQTDYVMAYLVKPVKAANVEAAITVAMARFDQYQLVRQQAHDLRRALEDRKTVERAKGMIMKRARVDEQEAFHRLQKLASDHNRKLVEAAQMVILAEEAFREP